MGFDLDRFERAKFVPRTREVAVDALAPFFGEGEPAVFVVRSLNSNELNRALEAEKRGVNVDAIIKALASGGSQVDAVRKALGLGADTPGEIRKRLEMLVLGSVTPAIESHVAAKIAENFAIEFRLLTNAILELTGQGYDLGKPAAASQQTPASSPACDSPSSEAASSTSADPMSSPPAG